MSKRNVKSLWTAAEDRVLFDLVTAKKSWEEIAQALEGRTPKQCRERWNGHVKPDIRKDSWTPEEDDLLLDLVQTIGPKWSKIATHFPGRTDSWVKNRYFWFVRRDKAPPPESWKFSIPFTTGPATHRKRRRQPLPPQIQQQQQQQQLQHRFGQLTPTPTPATVVHTHQPYQSNPVSFVQIQGFNAPLFGARQFVPQPPSVAPAPLPSPLTSPITVPITPPHCMFSHAAPPTLMPPFPPTHAARARMVSNSTTCCSSPRLPHLSEISNTPKVVQLPEPTTTNPLQLAPLDFNFAPLVNTKDNEPSRHRLPAFEQIMGAVHNRNPA